MRYVLVVAIALLCSSCGKQVLSEPPLGSFLPKYLEIDSIAPYVVDDTNKVVDSTLVDFTSIPIDSGLLTMAHGKLTLPGGVLISDRKATLYVFYKSSWERQQQELKYTKYLMQQYYDKSKEAEKMYQGEIIRWRRESQRSWLEKNMAYIGFGAGALTTILIEFAVFQASR